MDDEAREIARRASGRLAPQFGPALPAFVERELQHPGADLQRYTGVELSIAIAGLVVSVAQFAWQIYRDLKKDRTEVSSEALARQLRVQVEVPAEVTPAERDQVIRIVVEEVLASPTNV